MSFRILRFSCLETELKNKSSVQRIKKLKKDCKGERMQKKQKYILAIVAVFISIIIIASVLFGLLSVSRPVVIKSENYGFTSDMISYLIREELEDQIEYYKNEFGQNYLSAVSLDPEKSLKDQESPYGGSWFDHFYGIAVKKAKEILVSCESAKKEGISLTESEEADCNPLSQPLFGKVDIKKENLVKLLQYRALYEKYRESFNLKLTDSDYKSYYSKNRNKYDCIDYKCVTVRADVDQSLSDGKSVEELTLKAEDRAKRLLEDVRVHGFDGPVKEYLQETGSTDKLEDMTVISQKYIPDTPFFDWAFSEERKQGDAALFEGKYSFSVYYLEKPPYPYDYALSNGIIAVKDYGENKAGVLTKLRQKLSESVSDEKDFSKFILENGFEQSETGVLQKDGLPEPVLNWIYSKDRKSGDAEFCIYGKKIYAMRYSGNAGSYFDYVLKNDCMQSEFDAAIKAASKNTDIQVKNRYKFLIYG